MQKFIALLILSFSLVHSLPADLNHLAARSQEAAAPIVRQESVVNFDGSFKNSFQTGNGILVEEVGVPKNGPEGQFTAVQGKSAFPLPDGTIQETQYIADENGYQAFGKHLPTPPPVDPIILRALDWLASQPSTPDPSGKNY